MPASSIAVIVCAVSRGSLAIIALLLLLPKGAGLGDPQEQGAEQADQRPPSTRPVEVVRVIRSEAVEGGRRIDDVHNRASVIPHPAHRSWGAWGIGTRIVARTDEVDAEGRNFPVRREVRQLEAIDGDAAHLLVYPVRGDGTAEAPARLAIPAHTERGWVLLSRQSPQMLYWRRYEARVAFEVPATQPAGKDESSRRSRERRALAATGPGPREALPPEFDCAIIETVHLLVEDDAANDNPALSKAGDPLTLMRSYHSVDAPGWEVLVETYRARLGEDGFAADLELMWRWRIEWILRPGEPDPTPEQLRKDLPLGG